MRLQIKDYVFVTLTGDLCPDFYRGIEVYLCFIYLTELTPHLNTPTLKLKVIKTVNMCHQCHPTNVRLQY